MRGLSRCPHGRQDVVGDQFTADVPPATADVTPAVGRNDQLELRKHHDDLTAGTERGESAHLPAT